LIVTWLCRAVDDVDVFEHVLEEQKVKDEEETQRRLDGEAGILLSRQLDGDADIHAEEVFDEVVEPQEAQSRKYPWHALPEGYPNQSPIAPKKKKSGYGEY
jgi:hypothetical protein